MAVQLHTQAGVALDQCGIQDIQMFQDVLQGYQILVVSKDNFNGIIYKGPESDRKIFLYYSDSHYDVITSMAAFLSRN